VRDPTRFLLTVVALLGMSAMVASQEARAHSDREFFLTVDRGGVHLRAAQPRDVHVVRVLPRARVYDVSPRDIRRRALLRQAERALRHGQLHRAQHLLQRALHLRGHRARRPYAPRRAVGVRVPHLLLHY
jgi:hypothetical protein